MEDIICQKFTSIIEIDINKIYYYYKMNKIYKILCSLFCKNIKPHTNLSDTIVYSEFNETNKYSSFFSSIPKIES